MSKWLSGVTDEHRAISMMDTNDARWVCVKEGFMIHFTMVELAVKSTVLPSEQKISEAVRKMPNFAAFAVVAVASLQPARQLTRRALASTSLAASLAAVTRPRCAHAGIFGPDGPQSELQQLSLAQQRLNDLAGKLDRSDIRGDSDEGAIEVLQTLTIQQGGTLALMTRATGVMDLLDGSARSKAVDLSGKLAAGASAILTPWPCLP